jgi:hypothetical protein
MLDLKRSQADAVMRQTGIVWASDVGLAGKLKLVPVEMLVRWLEVHYDDSARKEHDRMERLERKLAEARDEQAIKARLPKFQKESREKVKAVLQGEIDKVPGCTLEPPAGGRPGRLEILYASSLDLITKIQLFGWCIIHQEEKFTQMTTPISTPKEGK